MDAATPSPTLPNPVGRPTDYTPELGAKFCALLAEGKSVRTACLDESMPCRTTIYTWLSLHPQFLDQYTRAKQDSADAIFEDAMDIADDGTNDYMEILDQKTGKTVTVFNKENVQRSKLRVETRKWAVSKLQPKKYGEAALIKTQQLDKQGDPTDPINTDAAVIAAKELLEKLFPGVKNDPE